MSHATAYSTTLRVLFLGMLCCSVFSHCRGQCNDFSKSSACSDPDILPGNILPSERESSPPSPTAASDEMVRDEEPEEAEEPDEPVDDGGNELLKMIIEHIISNYKFGTRSVLEKGLDPNSTFSNSTLEKGDVNASLLHLAAWLNSDESAEVLLNNDAEVDAMDSDGRTPLHYAAEKGHLKIAEMLIENGANVDAIDNEGETPLIDASFERHLAVVRLLIERGADVNIQDNDGDTALHEASFRGALQIVVALISNGAKLNAMDNDKETPLHEAAEFGYPEIVETLVLAGAKVDKKDKNGNRPIDVICVSAQPACSNNTYMVIKQSLSS